jgi:uncharacterized protein with HEPN domain
MPRSARVYLEDILEAAGKIRRYVGGRSRDGFSGDDMAVDAVVRNLEIIGEAAKGVPESVRSQAADIPWTKSPVYGMSSSTSTSVSTSRSSGT